MNINRHNYEEYFILYMDNELTGDERRMVEAFVEHHPDLKDELDNLIQYKLDPDTSIVFEGKEDLLKENGHSLITQNNQDEWFTLYIDNELGEEQKEYVDQYIAANPAAQNELTLLQQTKLQPETIVFAGKDLLYRKEEKVRRIPVWAWRAAAAILILAIAIPTALLLNKKPSGAEQGKETAKTGSNNAQTIPAENNSQPSPVNNEKAVAIEQTNPEVVPFVAEKNQQGIIPAEKVKDNNVATVTPKKQTVPVNSPDDKPVSAGNPVNKTEQVIAQENPAIKPSNNLPLPNNNPNINNKKTDDAIAYNPPPENKSPNKVSEPVVTNSNTPPSDYTQAAYNPDSKKELEQPDGKKNKNRGFFRKIARTFEKRTNIDPTDDDNRLLVAGLAIKLK